MTESYLPSLEGIKPLSELPRPVQTVLTEKQLDALEWAKNFMEKYERKRQW